MSQHEITSKHPLLDKNGHLIETGYAKSLILDYDRKAIKAKSLRIKEWDYYLIYNDDFGVALTVDDNSYMALDSISLLDFRKPWEHTNSPMKFMTMGKRNFPTETSKGDVVANCKNYSISFKHNGDHRLLSFYMKKFKDGKPIKGEIRLENPLQDSMVICTPWREKKTAFYYNQKIIAMPASGKVEFDGRTYEFRREDSFGLLDWGRGVWTYKNTWYWGAAQGMVDGHRFGWNIGYGFGDTSNASENMFFINDEAYKLRDVHFEIPYNKKNKEDYLSPWTFTSESGDINLTFNPLIDRYSNTNALLIQSKQHQVFGVFNGKITVKGKAFEIDNLIGFAEKVKNRW